MSQNILQGSPIDLYIVNPNWQLTTWMFETVRMWKTVQCYLHFELSFFVLLFVASDPTYYYLPCLQNVIAKTSAENIRHFNYYILYVKNINLKFLLQFSLFLPFSLNSNVKSFLS